VLGDVTFGLCACRAWVARRARGEQSLNLIVMGKKESVPVSLTLY